MVINCEGKFQFLQGEMGAVGWVREAPALFHVQHLDFLCRVCNFLSLSKHTYCVHTYLTPPIFTKISEKKPKTATQLDLLIFLHNTGTWGLICLKSLIFHKTSANYPTAPELQTGLGWEGLKDHFPPLLWELQLMLLFPSRDGDAEGGL